MTKKDDSAGNERRQEKRRPILETFAFSIVIPKKGLYRLGLNDLSESGIGFDIDIEGEDPDYPVKVGESIEFRFYVNRSLFIPLTATVARLEERTTGRRVGASFKNKTDPNYKAFLAVLQILEVVADVAQVDAQG